MQGKVVPVRLVQRVAHVHAFATGRSAQEEAASSPAALEIAALYRWVMTVTRRQGS